MEVGKVYRLRSKTLAILTMKIKSKKFEILIASSLGLSQTFHAKIKVISRSSKKYWFFDWGTTRILSFGSSIWCEFLKRQSFFVFSQNFFITRNKAEFSISGNKIEIEHQIRKLWLNFRDGIYRPLYIKARFHAPDNVAITLLFVVRFQFSFQIWKI